MHAAAAAPDVDQSILIDLASSGLSLKDLNGRVITSAELAATQTASSGINGYVIPYYDFKGRPVPFYRVKLIDHEPKYKQPKNTGNYVYFPSPLQKCLANPEARVSGHRYIVICEGEKKAACATKLLIPAVALGGVDSWRNRTIILPGATALSAVTTPTGEKQIRAKLPSTISASTMSEAVSLAVGMTDLVAMIREHDLFVIIAYDSDAKEGGLKPEVQRAAAALAYELRYQGVPIRKIRQVILPRTTTIGKTGLDDYVVSRGAKSFQQLVLKAILDPTSFPRHPNARLFISNKLETGKLSRKQTQEISLTILTELDARGQRLRDTGTGTPYYFDRINYKLMPALLMQHQPGENLHESPFGTYLYREFGLSGADSRILIWLASQFTGEDPILSVTPQRVVCLTKSDPLNPDGIAMQMSDSQFVSVSPDPKKAVTVHNNGTQDILFEQDQVEPLDAHQVMEHVNEQMSLPKFPNYWSTVVDELNIESQNERLLATLLPYVSPWLQRWRGIQLPVEIVTGEAGSGKSSLYMVRMTIITGRPRLRNLPTDLRDWYASLANAGGLHVTDNVQFTNRELRQRMSDEICRLVTEPSPQIEQRKLYTNSAQAHIPVNCTFAMTAIQQPFQNSDLIQRSAVMQLAALGKDHDGDWVSKQIDSVGGREAWVAHHLVFLHKFLHMASRAPKDGGWDTNFKTAHRLAHLEQILRIACRIIGADPNMVPGLLSEGLEESIEESDWTLAGIKDFCDDARVLGTRNFTAVDIAAWASLNDDHNGNRQLTNGRGLGRYMKAHAGMLLKYLQIRVSGNMNNRVVWGFTGAPPSVPLPTQVLKVGDAKRAK